MYKSKGIHIEEEKVLTEPSHNIYIKWFSDFFFVLVILKELTSLRRKNRMLMKSHPFCEDINLKYCCQDRVNLKIKKMISMPLMTENPVRSPMVPPMRLSWASVLIFLSFSMSSKVAVSK